MLIHTHSYACTPHKHTHTHVLQTVHWNAHWAGWLQAAAIGQEVFLRELPAPCPPPSRSLLCRVCEKNCYASKHAGTVTVVSGPWKNATQACRHCPCCVGYVKEIAMQACTHCHCRVRYSEKRYASTLALSLFFRVCERNCYASMQALSLLWQIRDRKWFAANEDHHSQHTFRKRRPFNCYIDTSIPIYTENWHPTNNPVTDVALATKGNPPWKIVGGPWGL